MWEYEGYESISLQTRRGTGFMINVTGHFWIWISMHMWESAHTNVWNITHYVAFFSPFTWQRDGAVKFYSVAINLECCMFFFVFTSLVMAKRKCKRNKNKIKTEKHTKIHNIVLHLADGQYIFSVLLVVCNVYVTPLSFSAGVWKLGCGCRAQVQPPPVSYIQYHKTLSHYKSLYPSVSGPFTFWVYCL